MTSTDAQIQSRLDLEIATLRNTLCNLVAQRNSLSPVSKLPVEILSTIFWMHQQSDLSVDDTAFNWIRVSHVCRQWRQIAINLPQLWSYINFRYPLWTLEMVKRSQKLGFIISIRSTAGQRHCNCDWNDKLHAIRDFIKHYMNRIREINIDVFPDELNYVLKLLLRPFTGKFNKNAPQLHAIRLPEVVTRQADPTPFLETFFVHAGNLKVLDLTCTRNWDSKLFTNLSHLKVVNPKGFGRPKRVEFFSALERMPQLKTLYLRGDVLPLFPVHTPKVENKPLPLPELRFLTVEDDASLIPDFLECIKIDSPLAVDIRHGTPTTDFADVLNTMTLLPSNYSSSTSLRGLRLDLSMNTSSAGLHNIQLEIETWHGVPSASSLETGSGVNPFVGDPFLNLGLSWWTGIEPIHEARQTRSALSLFSRIFPCENLSVLSLTSSDLENELPAIHRSLFSSFLGTQPDIHTIFVSGSILSAFVLNLKPRLKGTPSVATVQDNAEEQEISETYISFPKLRHLSISCFDFSNRTSDLFHCLFARTKYGHKLETLTISNCDGLDDRVLIGRLDGVVNHLAWDQRRLSQLSS